MLKFREIGTLKNATNVGYCVTPVALKNGYGVTVDLSTKTVALPTADTAKGDVYIVLNKIDKPEVNEPNDYTIDIGEYPRAFRVKSLDGRIIDMDTDAVTTAYSALAKGDTLGFGTDGKLVKLTDTTGYATYFEVIDKTTFGGEGIALKVVVA